MLPIGPIESDQLSRDRGDGLLNIVRALGVGGSQWFTITMTGGDFAPPTSTQSDPFEGYVCLERDVQPIASQTGTIVSDDLWILVAPDSPPVQTGDRIKSVADNSLEFVVGEVSERPYDVFVAHVERV